MERKLRRNAIVSLTHPPNGDSHGMTQTVQITIPPSALRIDLQKEKMVSHIYGNYIYVCIIYIYILYVNYIYIWRDKYFRMYSLYLRETKWEINFSSH